MRRISLLTAVAFTVIVAAAIAAAPTATVTDVSDSSVTIGTLKCATNYRFAVRTVNANGTTSAAKTINQATKPCPPPPPPADSDGDGVPDSSDTCPGTPPGTQVDATGCPVNNPPPPPPPGDEPAPIAGQGYHQAFRDDFTTLDRSVWDDHIWYDEAPNPAWTNFQTVDANGVLHLQTKRQWLGDTGVTYPYNTVTTQTSGKTFQYGYFETRMKWPAGHGSWPAFWLYSYKHATDASQCTTQAGEIDVMEGQGSEPTNWYGTVHSNTNGCAPDDQQNGNNYRDAPTDLTQDFHTYGVKWTPTSVTWYLDGVQTHTAPTYATDNQPMYLLLQEWTGGWTYDTDATTPDTLDNQVDYVSVWQQ